jgi:hypothetical protein
MSQLSTEDCAYTAVEATGLPFIMVPMASCSRAPNPLLLALSVSQLILPGVYLLSLFSRNCVKV